MIEYPVTVEDVRSGDDLIVLVELGIDDLYKKVRCRLRGVDTPDAYKASRETLAGQIRTEVRRITLEHKCKIIVSAMNRNGWIVDLIIMPKDDVPVNVNELLMQRGYVYNHMKDDSNVSEG